MVVDTVFSRFSEKTSC